MGKKLTTTVWVKSEGSSMADTSFGPGDELPKWAADQVGDHVYAEEVDPLDGALVDEEQATPAPAKKAAAKS